MANQFFSNTNNIHCYFPEICRCNNLVKHTKKLTALNQPKYIIMLTKVLISCI